MSNLIKYEAACRAIAECKSFDEVKSWADKAAAMQAYQRMAGDKTLESDAAEIRIRAERRLGQMLSESDLQKGGRPAVSETGRQSRPVSAPKLADVGISKDLSSRAQKLAAVPEAEFEAELAAKREREREEGARVTARLVQSGERHMNAAAPAPAAPPPEEDDAHDSLEDIVDELQRENSVLQKQVEAIAADDPKAEALKWIKLADHARRQQDAAQERAVALEKEARRLSRALNRCGKAVGEEDPDKIPAVVEAFVRKHKDVPCK